MAVADGDISNISSEKTGLEKDIGLKLKKCKWSIENIKHCLNQYTLENSLTFKDI